MSLFAELKRRNVFRVGAAYVVVGWLLTEISTTLLPTFGAPEWIAKTTIFVFALAFVPVMIFAWAFEMTPEGIKREKDVVRDASITSATGKKLDYVTIVAVIVGVAFLGYSKVAPDNRPVVETEVIETYGAPSVAVLPFVNMSGNAENEYFSDGLTETLLHMLVQIPDLKVAARTSSFAFKGKDTDIREIAAILDVAHVLEGSVQRAGNRVRITAQLIRASDGFHVWSENYDRTLDDIFGIQDEIAGRVGTALSASLLGTENSVTVVSVGTENLEAYDLYLRALAESAMGSYGSLQVAEGLLKDALALDPDFHAAKTKLAQGYIAQGDTGLMDEPAALRDAIALLEQVLNKQPNDVLAQSVWYYATVYSSFQSGDIETLNENAELFEQLVDEHPKDTESAALLVRALRFQNRDKEALQLMESLVTSDPLNAHSHYDLALGYASLDRFEDARDAALRSLEIEPMQPNAQGQVARAERSLGNGLAYLQNFLIAIEIDPKDHELPGFVAHFLYVLDLPELADSYRSRVLAIAPSSGMALDLNLRHFISIGDIESARDIARQYIEDDIDDRQGAYTNAVVLLVDGSVRDGNVAEVMAYLEENVPHLEDLKSNVEFKYRISSFTAMMGWHETLPQEELFRRADDLYAFSAKVGFKIDEDPGQKVFKKLLYGDSEGVVDLMVDGVFAKPLTTNLYWDEFYTLPLFAEVMADPRVQVEVRRWVAEKAALREEVREFMENRL